MLVASRTADDPRSSSVTGCTDSREFFASPCCIFGSSSFAASVAGRGNRLRRGDVGTITARGIRGIGVDFINVLAAPHDLFS